MEKRLILLLLFFLQVNILSSQVTISPEILNKAWEAKWIEVPEESPENYGIYHFRKSFQLESKPDSFIIHVSADNRYKLYVNGTLVSLGPSRGDLFHWNFETVDISSFLHIGKNVLAAVVWNFGSFKPEAQISFKTGFILQGNSDAESKVNTNNSWKSIKNEGYSPLQPELGHVYYVAGPGEQVDFEHFPWGWETVEANDSNWKNAREIEQGLPKGVFGWSTGWMLVPRAIPPMELKPERLAVLRKSVGVIAPAGFPKEKISFTIPANTKATLIIDQTYLTNAYPVMIISGGKGSNVSLRYAESMYWQEGKKIPEVTNKGNRNEVEGKIFIGVKDKFISDGGSQRSFSPLWWRTYRFIELSVETKEEALIINDLYGIFTGYPFEAKAKFESEKPELGKILEIGWRTARLCAIETYVDCPYYEQLQYVGDTRIQALVSLYYSGDDRLMKNALGLLNNSRVAEGFTLSRYPTAHPQEITPFSLWWIGMANDYYMYQTDTAFVSSLLPGVRAVLDFFNRLQKGNGSLKLVPYWNFTDWVIDKSWAYGIAPYTLEGNSAALDLQLLLAYQASRNLENDLGMKAYGEKYQLEIDRLKQTIRDLYWDDTRKLFADTPEKNNFSQHINSLAVLTGVIIGHEATQLMEKVLSDQSLKQCTIYFKYYLHQAVSKAGLGNRYLSLLDEWNKQIGRGMTTWAESPEPSRSDCHAWGASPNIEFFRIVLGIDTDGPRFSKVIIKPNLGGLTKASGSIPHPQGEISVKYLINKKKRLDAEITIPPGVSGNFVWEEKVFPLKPGELNKFQF